MACCQGVEAQCKQYFPAEDNQIKITEWYLKYFSGTPLVMLHGGQLKYAVSRGAGWRADCFGDYGLLRSYVEPYGACLSASAGGSGDRNVLGRMLRSNSRSAA